MDNPAVRVGMQMKFLRKHRKKKKMLQPEETIFDAPIPGES
ncbi:MAG: hypothetical protein CM15mV68_350 [uncultured marine virus]|nr:MAG: hypothetical protein CM15mV68_350 [uncultured marine virus]